MDRIKITALILMGFTAVTAILSGLALVFYPDGHLFQMPVSLLDHSPFENFRIPGLVLAVLVGGSNLAGAFSMAFDYNYAGRMTLLAGIQLTLWILVQYLLIRTFDWLQVFYLIIGLALIWISLQERRLHSHGQPEF